MPLRTPVAVSPPRTFRERLFDALNQAASSGKPAASPHELDVLALDLLRLAERSDSAVAPRADAERSDSSPAPAEDGYPVRGLMSPELLAATEEAIAALHIAALHIAALHSARDSLHGTPPSPIVAGLVKLRQGVREHERAKRVSRLMTVLLRAAEQDGALMGSQQKERLAMALLEEEEWA